MKILVDTNVFLDLILKRSPFYEDGVEFLSLCKKQRHKIYISAMSFRDIEYIVRKISLDKEKTKKILNSVYSLVDKIIPITADDAINAIFDYEKDFEDYLISCACESAMLDCIVTNNKKDFFHKTVSVFSVKELNERLSALPEFRQDLHQI